jgi:DNA-directed RNA polymerase omega subunit
LIQIPDNIDSKYRFVILSALRARQLQGGSVPMIKESRGKATQVAQKELLQQLVKFRVPDGSENGAAQVEEASEE